MHLHGPDDRADGAGGGAHRAGREEVLRPPAAWFVIHLVVLDDVEKFIPGLRTAAKAAVARI
ncbi:MAG: hypothetical protein AUG49_02255 [Catenulispora sp. 13_1_20CM_3_70_7]|nr:MAG: hypothetical protein AUG49_02255 [Catenulispora sp. 13_1_20CM_3_70_7]